MLISAEVNIDKASDLELRDEHKDKETNKHKILGSIILITKIFKTKQSLIYLIFKITDLIKTDFANDT